jgi:hypothetical protein
MPQDQASSSILRIGIWILHRTLGRSRHHLGNSMVTNARDLFNKSPKTIYKIQMGRKTIQIIWILAASHPNYILTTNGETN